MFERECHLFGMFYGDFWANPFYINLKTEEKKNCSTHSTSVSGVLLAPLWASSLDWFASVVIIKSKFEAEFYTKMVYYYTGWMNKFCFKMLSLLRNKIHDEKSSKNIISMFLKI